MGSFARELRENKEIVIIAVIIAAMIGLLVGAMLKNNQMNESMVGKPKAALIETFGPPTLSAPSYEDSEVLEWRRHNPGYYSSHWNSDGRGGGYMSQTYIPPSESVRRAVIRNGRCVSCEGGL